MKMTLKGGMLMAAMSARRMAKDADLSTVGIATHSNHEVITLTIALANMPNRQQTYTVMLGRMAYQRVPPGSWPVLLDEIRAFIDPLVEDTTGRLVEWDPEMQIWTQPNA